jgi:hypothetical protein
MIYNGKSQQKMDDLVVPHFRTGLVSQRNSTALGSRMLVGFWREKVMEC